MDQKICDNLTACTYRLQVYATIDGSCCAISPVAKPQIFGQSCNTVRTKFFCCFYTSDMCSLRIWMMPLCHPWAIRTICKLRPPLLKIMFLSISQ